MRKMQMCRECFQIMSKCIKTMRVKDLIENYELERERWGEKKITR